MSTMGDAVSDRLRELEIRFTRMEATLTTKLDELTRSLQPRNEDVEARLRLLEATSDPTHEARIGRLEQWRWLVTGASLAAGGAAGSVAGFLFNAGVGP
ncbi:MAG: hypothetical protein AB7L91_18025 [Dehalococcoidia bacterium]